MTFRPAALALAVLLAAGSAHAERLQTGGIQLSPQSAMQGANIAAGFGNRGPQMGGGGGGHPLVSTDTQVATNVAAGLNNEARQQVVGLQGGGPNVGVGLDFSGRGPLVSTRVGVATNVAAGLNNRADQGVLAQQR